MFVYKYNTKEQYNADKNRRKPFIGLIIETGECINGAMEDGSLVPPDVQSAKTVEVNANFISGAEGDSSINLDYVDYSANTIWKFNDVSLLPTYTNAENKFAYLFAHVLDESNNFYLVGIANNTSLQLSRINGGENAIDTGQDISYLLESGQTSTSIGGNIPRLMKEGTTLLFEDTATTIVSVTGVDYNYRFKCAPANTSKGVVEITGNCFIDGMLPVIYVTFKQQASNSATDTQLITEGNLAEVAGFSIARQDDVVTYYKEITPEKNCYLVATRSMGVYKGTYVQHVTEEVATIAESESYKISEIEASTTYVLKRSVNTARAYTGTLLSTADVMRLTCGTIISVEKSLSEVTASGFAININSLPVVGSVLLFTDGSANITSVSGDVTNGIITCAPVVTNDGVFAVSAITSQYEWVTQAIVSVKMLLPFEALNATLSELTNPAINISLNTTDLTSTYQDLNISNDVRVCVGKYLHFSDGYEYIIDTYVPEHADNASMTQSLVASQKISSSTNVEAHYVANNIYWLHNNNGTWQIKAKGLDQAIEGTL